jgi:hypothetical protein
MADRWMIAETTTDDRGARIPVHTARLDGWSGQIINVPESMGLPFSGDVFGLRAYASPAVLDDVESQAGVWSVRDGGDFPKQAAADWLNRKFGKSYTVAEWEQRFFVAVG